MWWMDGAHYPTRFYTCCPHCLFIPPKISFCHCILCIWTKGVIIFLRPEKKSKKLACNFSEVLYCRVFPFVIKLLKSLMVQICIRVIYVCNIHFLLYISPWEEQIHDCSLQTLHTMLCAQCAFVVIFSVLWVFILLKYPGYSERALKMNACCK